jgi:hypothetical protein
MLSPKRNPAPRAAGRASKWNCWVANLQIEVNKAAQPSQANFVATSELARRTLRLKHTIIAARAISARRLRQQRQPKDDRELTYEGA